MHRPPHRHHGRHIPQRPARRREVPVEERDRLAVTEHHVLGADVVVPDHRSPARIGKLVVPRVRRGVEPGGSVVQPALEARDADQRGLRHRPLRERRDRHIAFDERPHFPALLVDAERTRDVIEPHVVEVLQQRDDRPGEGARGPANRVPDPHHLAEVGDPAGELLLFGAHAGRIAGGLRRLVVMRRA